MILVGALFPAGFVAGILITIGLFAVNAVMARRYGWGGNERASVEAKARCRARRGCGPSRVVLAPLELSYGFDPAHFRVILCAVPFLVRL